MKVALFVTCLTDTFYPRTAIAVVKVLERLGCEVSFPQAQTCCGQPMYNNGFHDEARALARRMVDVFAGSAYVVTPSGSCAAMMHEHYATLLADDPRHAQPAHDLAARTYEFNRFLTEVLKVDLRALGARWPGRVTYHYACHQRGIGVKSPIVPDTADAAPPQVREGSPMAPEADPAVRLLQQIDALDYVQLPRADQCCGFGGTFATKMPEISGAMVRDKVACIASTQADTCVCNEGGCTMNIAGAIHRAGLALHFTSVAEIIAEGLGLLERRMFHAETIG